MRKRIIILLFCMVLTTFLLTNIINVQSNSEESGIWGGIDWVLHEDGTLVISPTKGTPEIDPRTGKPCEVGVWRERVRYDPLAIDERLPYNVSQIRRLVIEEGVTHIGSFIANKMTNLSGELIIPSSVTYIGQEAFQNTKLENIIFANAEIDSENKLCIEAGAFKNTQINSIILPKRLKCMHNWALLGNKNLEYVTLLSEDIKMGGTPHLDYEGKVGATFTNHGTRQFFAYDYNLKKISFANETTRDNFLKESGSGGYLFTLAHIEGNDIYTLDGLIDKAVNNGNVVTLTRNTTIVSHNTYGKDTITVPSNIKIVIADGITLTNNGDIYNFGSLDIEGTGKMINNGIYYTYEPEKEINITSNRPKQIYTISYDLQNGTVSYPNEFYHLGVAKNFTLNNPIKEGYTFKGWSGTGLDGDENLEVTVNIPTGSQENYNFVANWIPNSYIIKFNPNGGTGTMTDMNITYGETLNINTNQFTNYDLIFNGWNTASDGTGTAYYNGQTITNLSSENGKEIILYAQWKSKPAPIVNNQPPINNEEIKSEIVEEEKTEIIPEEEVEEEKNPIKEIEEEPPIQKNNNWLLIIILIISGLSVSIMIVKNYLKNKTIAI